METVVGVRFKKAGKVYYFDPGDLEIFKTDKVILETARGLELGEVVVGPKEVSEKEVVSPLKQVIRKATKEDMAAYEGNKGKEKDAFEICSKKIEDHGLEMKLVDVEYTFDNNKIIFFFTAEGRVDFRELVKDLASVFKTRIELRQIGVRDEAKMIGGYGPCGVSLCCSTWLGEFDPVSIKMAKDQGLSLNPTKISGVCGRLFCCLKYEHEVYKAVLKKMPQQGDRVKTQLGTGVIVKTNPLLEQVKVRVTLEEDGSEEIKIFPIEEITKIPKGSRGKPEDGKKKEDGKKQEDSKKTEDRKKMENGKKNEDSKTTGDRRKSEGGKKSAESPGKEKSPEGKKPDEGQKAAGEKKSSREKTEGKKASDKKPSDKKSKPRSKRPQGKKRPPRGSQKKGKSPQEKPKGEAKGPSKNE
ncbi:stage 0 sporulation protein [Isachenkonia alkalipeptolytica]|uniref:Stage 0 sporulation protein n=1 Tax=Isachenkonia alkalipeptolytica TaxID=2565777 RepID=A0AA44BE93_9CLOT|nr:stage 0 sporulation protein [Isachenkonia alkalipeptolytica]